MRESDAKGAASILFVYEKGDVGLRVVEERDVLRATNVRDAALLLVID